MGIPARTARAGSSTLSPNEKGSKEGQLVAGQWVEVSIEGLHAPVLLSGFVLSLRPNEVLLTFPELLEPPEGLEAEAHASVRYSNLSGSFIARGPIVRVASGPPVTVTFKRLLASPAELRQAAARSSALFPVSMQILSSRVEASVGLDGVSGMAQLQSERRLLLKTSLLLAVGDSVRLVASDEPEVCVQGRVVTVSESEGQFSVGIDLNSDGPANRERWLHFTARRRQVG
jgi:hypothetical protein